MKKGAKIAACIAAVIAVLGGAGFYLSQTLIKWKSMEYFILPSFSDGMNITEPYPYADIEVPESFRECSVKGIDFEAPDGLFWMYPDETKGVKSGILVDNDDISKRDLLICVGDKEENGIRVEDFEKAGFFDKRALKGMKKLGCEKPENSHDLMFLCETFDYKKCNRFSPSEVSATYNILMMKAILVPASASMKFSDQEVDLGVEIEDKRFWYDNDRMMSFIQQGTRMQP